jgi:hypothetical protein
MNAAWPAAGTKAPRCRCDQSHRPALQGYLGVSEGIFQERRKRVRELKRQAISSPGFLHSCLPHPEPARPSETLRVRSACRKMMSGGTLWRLTQKICAPYAILERLYYETHEKNLREANRGVLDNHAVYLRIRDHWRSFAAPRSASCFSSISWFSTPLPRNFLQSNLAVY